MPKKKAKAKTGKKVIQKQKQTVIVNVTKRGGGKSKGRSSAPRPQQIPQVIFQQQPQQFPQQERPHTNERERSHVDEILNVVQQANAIYRQQPPPQSVSTTNVDVGSILTGTATVLKTGLDIYRNYSRRGNPSPVNPVDRGQRGVPASDIPARPAVPPRPLRGDPVNPSPVNPVDRGPRGVPAPQRPRPIVPPVPLFRPTPSAPTEPVPVGGQRGAAERKKTPMELSTEKMLADRDRRNKMTLEAKESGKPLIPFMNFPPRLERKEEKRVELPAPSASAPARPSFHIKNILGQIESKGSVSSAKNQLKSMREASQMPALERVSLGQMGARSILGTEQKDNFDFQKRARQLRREGIAMRREGKANIRQNAKSAPASREIPIGPSIAGKRKGY